MFEMSDTQNRGRGKRGKTRTRQGSTILGGSPSADHVCPFPDLALEDTSPPKKKNSILK